MFFSSEDKCSLNILFTIITYQRTFKSNQGKICYSFVHSYFTYRNIAWCSAPVPKLRQSANQWKLSFWIFASSLCKLGLHQFSKRFKFYVADKESSNTSNNGNTLHQKLKQIHDKYSTGFSHGSFEEPKLSLRLTKYFISLRGRRLWNKLTNAQIKSLEYEIIFKKTLKIIWLHWKMNLAILARKCRCWKFNRSIGLSKAYGSIWLLFLRFYPMTLFELKLSLWF